jgi:hypothetical protein
MLKRQTVTIQDVYVPVKRRQALDPKKVKALAESILTKGQEAPILVRPEDRDVTLTEYSWWHVPRGQLLHSPSR